MRIQRLCLFLLAVFISACGVSSPPRDFADADLLIGKSVMPDNWSMLEVSSKWLWNEGQEGGTYITFYATNTTFLVRGGEDIYRFKNASRAAWHYKRFEREHFNDDRYYITTPWEVPEGFKFFKSLANQCRFACAGDNFSLGTLTGKTATICIYLAQYEEYLIFFSITIERDGVYYISVEEIAPILEAIDHKMGQYLYP
jgi:hypothetical protein